MQARAVGWLVVFAVAVVTCGGPAGSAPISVDPGIVARGIDERAPFPSISSLHPGGRGILFVGNSLTFVNNLPRVIGELATSVRETPRIVSVTEGGYWLQMHAQDASTPGSALFEQLRTNDAFDVVTLQEQSRVPSYPIDHHDAMASREAASRLAARTSAPIVVYATWGHERGDPWDPDISPDFDAMEEHLERGYRAMAERLVRDGHRVRLAPVGPAFARIHRAVLAAGGRPTERRSSFDALYADDGYHPGPAGTYLAACVIYGTITGRDPLTFGGAPSLELDRETERGLRLVARATLADPEWTPAP